MELSIKHHIKEIESNGLDEWYNKIKNRPVIKVNYSEKIYDRDNLDNNIMWYYYPINEINNLEERIKKNGLNNLKDFEYLEYYDNKYYFKCNNEISDTKITKILNIDIKRLYIAGRPFNS